MKDKICLITGGSSGIGKATAIGLVKLGARVVIVARDRSRGEAARDEIKSTINGSQVDLLLADLSLIREVRRLADEIKRKYPHLHVLVNNAGISLTRRSVTDEGIEKTFAVNYLAPFLLTNLLLDTLKASSQARVINVAGDFHRKATIHFDDLMSEKDYNGLQVNNQAKLALILFTYELARRLEGTGVTVNALHPGAVATDGAIKDPDLPASTRLMIRLFKPFFLSPEKGARTSIFLASSPEVAGITGGYFIKSKPARSSSETYDQAIAGRLWAESARLTGLDI